MSNISKYWDHKQFDFSLTNHELVKSALEKIKANKAKGHDHIPPRALKASIPSVTQPLSHLITLSLVLKRSPIPGNEVRLCRISKRTRNWRKWIIDLLQFFHRFPSSLNISYINSWLTTSKIYFISICSGTRNITAVLPLTEQWKEDLDKQNIIGTIAIDLTKDFHCLSHDLGETKILWPKRSCVIFNA